MKKLVGTLALLAALIVVSIGCTNKTQTSSANQLRKSVVSSEVKTSQVVDDDEELEKLYQKAKASTQPALRVVARAYVSKRTKPFVTKRMTTRPAVVCTSRPAIEESWMPVNRTPNNILVAKPIVKSATSQPFKASAIGPYVPPSPNPPTTFSQRLGTILLDQRAAYTVHAIACDRSALYAMFPAEAKFYLINATHKWYWGDGTSNVGSEQTHIYPRAGTYSVQTQIDLSFRGGATCRIIGEIPIDVTEPKSDPILTISDLQDITAVVGQPATTQYSTVTNSGGRAVVARPRIEKIDGTIEDLSWISISPQEAIVINDNVPVSFAVTLNWPAAPTGTIQLKLSYDTDLITNGWNVPYISGTVTPP